jgi:beta-xylosidase
VADRRVGGPAQRIYAILRVALLATLFVALAAAVGFDLHARSAIQRTQVPLVAAQHRLTQTDSTLAETVRAASATSALREQRQVSIGQNQARITQTEQKLASVVLGDKFQSFDIDTLQTCIGKVNLAQVAALWADRTAAASALTAASPSCLLAEGTAGGLVYPFDFPDPFILTAGGQYYAYSTASVTGNIQVLQSPDLVHWTSLGDALPTLPTWSQPGRTWAPSVLQLGSSYVMYYTTELVPIGAQCISDAVSSQPQGPFVDTTTAPLVCQLAGNGSIDPSPFVGTDGMPYLTWMSYGVTGDPSTMWSQQLTPAGTALVPGAPSSLLQPSESWQHGYIEGPDMVVSGGHYVLFYAASDWKSADYAIGWAECSGPLGPCRQQSNQPLLTSGAQFKGPGGPAVFADGQGNLWMAFAAWLPGRLANPNSRMLFVQPLTIVDGVPQLGS